MTVADQSIGALLTDRLEEIKLDRGDEHLLHVEFRRNILCNFLRPLKT